MNSQRTLGAVACAGFMACVPLANWMILHVGTTCIPNGPCLIPVAPGILAPSGVLTIGLALVLRDVVQRCLGTRWGLLAIVLGTALSVLVAPRELVVASASAFLLSEVADFAVYTPLQRRGLTRAVLASSMAGLVIDSLVFLLLAFGSLDLLAGQVLGKLWAVLISISLLQFVRRVTPAPA
jgi:queuosine precursor transporter